MVGRPEAHNAVRTALQQKQKEKQMREQVRDQNCKESPSVRGNQGTGMSFLLLVNRISRTFSRVAVSNGRDTAARKDIASRGKWKNFRENSTFILPVYHSYTCH